MKSTMKSRLSATMGRLVLALVMAGAVTGTLVAPVRADDRDRFERERFERERFERERFERERERERFEREREWRMRHHPQVYVAPPPVVYAPPPVVYAPPPPPSGINLIFPLNIR